MNNGINICDNWKWVCGHQQWEQIQYTRIRYIILPHGNVWQHEFACNSPWGSPHLKGAIQVHVFIHSFITFYMDSRQSDTIGNDVTSSHTDESKGELRACSYCLSILTIVQTDFNTDEGIHLRKHVVAVVLSGSTVVLTVATVNESWQCLQAILCVFAWISHVLHLYGHSVPQITRSCSTALC